MKSFFYYTLCTSAWKPSAHWFWRLGTHWPIHSFCKNAIKWSQIITLDDISAGFYLPDTNRHWRGTTYRDNLISTSYESVVEFLAWLKKLLVSENEIVRKAALKQSISPGFPENPTKMCRCWGVFNLCNDVVLSNQNGSCTKRDHLSFMSATNPKYSNCGDRNIMNGHITQDNIVGMADCWHCPLRPNRKWNIGSLSRTQMMFLHQICEYFYRPSVTIGTHMRNEHYLRLCW